MRHPPLVRFFPAFGLAALILGAAFIRADEPEPSALAQSGHRLERAGLAIGGGQSSAGGTVLFSRVASPGLARSVAGNRTVLYGAGLVRVEHRNEIQDWTLYE